MKKEHSFIPIKNMYYMLCYAWNMADQKDRIKVNADSCKTYPDLFGKLLARGCTLLLKRGLSHDYIETKEAVYGIKGKWQVAPSLSTSKYEIGLMECSYDEFSRNILVNQIIYSTLRKLISCHGLSHDVLQEIKRVYHRFPEVDTIQLCDQAFKRVYITSENRFYALLIHICEIIHENLLPEEKRGDYQFVRFATRKMNVIFEEFLRNFYRQECKEEYPDVRRSDIEFQLHTISGQDSIIPKMQTDITLINKKANKAIIIDAKYYTKTLVSKKNGSQPKIRSTHLYQIQNYIRNQENPSVPYTMNANGILIYPEIDQRLDYTGIVPNTNHFFRFVTVNLNEDWWKIDKRLRQIIQF